MMNLKIDHEKCLRCGACAKDCIAFALTMKDSFPAVADGGEERCIQCQHCLAICPTGALSIFGLSAENSCENRNLPSAEQTGQLIRNRRSFRNYRHENIDRSCLKILTDALAWVPTGVNDHRLHFCIVDDVEVMDGLRREMADRLLDAIRTGSLPEGLDGFERFKEPLEQGVDVLCRTAPHMVIACAPAESPCPSIDPVIALSYFELLAQSMNIGTTWCGLVYLVLSRLAPDLLTRLGMPEGYIPGYVMLFGSPAVRYPRATQPKAVSVTFAKR